MLARRLESDGDVKGALAALDRAEKLDPKSAEVLAERAGLHARQNQGPEAHGSRGARARARHRQRRSASHSRARLLGLVRGRGAPAGRRPPPETARQKRSSTAGDSRYARDGAPSPWLDLQIAWECCCGRRSRRGAHRARNGRVPGAISRRAVRAPRRARWYVEGRVLEAAEALAQAAEINPRYYVSPRATCTKRRGAGRPPRGHTARPSRGVRHQPRSAAALDGGAAQRSWRGRCIAREGRC